MAHWKLFIAENKNWKETPVVPTPLPNTLNTTTTPNWTKNEGARLLHVLFDPKNVITALKWGFLLT